MLTAVLKELGYLDEDEEKDTSIEDSKHDRKEDDASL